jgi:hypothetical protein
VDQNERNGLKPIDRETSRAAATRCARSADLPPDSPPDRSTAAPDPPFGLCDLSFFAACSRREALLLLAAIALLSTPIAAAPAVPTAADARRRRLEARLATDPRLDQKISLAAWAEPLEDVLARVSRETGVSFAFEGRDVGDQRVNMVLKDQPLRRVLALLAETLDLFWLRDRKAPQSRYTLFQDARSRKAEQELLSRAREGFEEGIRRLVDSLKLTPPEIEKLRERAPWWAPMLSDSRYRLAVRLLGKLAPTRWDQLMQTGNVEIPYASLSAADQEAVRQFAEEKNRDKKRIQNDLERGQPGEHHIGDLTQLGGKVVIEIYDGVPAGPDSEFGIRVESADGHGNGSSLGLGYTPEEQRLLREEFAPPGFEKEKRNPPPDGGPRVTVAWKQKLFLPWEQVLKAVAEGAHLQVVSDSFLYYWSEHNSHLPDPSALRDHPLLKVLDQVSEPFFHSWRRDGDIYLFRQRNWFIEKQHNIPERDLRRWRGHLKARGRLTLEDLVELALLTDRQLGLLYHTPISTHAVNDHRELLRLYAALNPFQRARLETTGVRLGELSEPQMELMRGWKPTAPVDDGTRLRLRREPEAVVFTMTTEHPAPLEERVPLESGRTPPSN